MSKLDGVGLRLGLGLRGTKERNVLRNVVELGIMYS